MRGNYGKEWKFEKIDWRIEESEKGCERCSGREWKRDLMREWKKEVMKKNGREKNCDERYE